MQLLINYSGKLKLSPVVSTYEELRTFVQQQFKPSQPWNMNYIDCDGDRICLSAEEDFQSLSDYNKKMTMIKINVVDDKNRKEFQQYSKQTMSFTEKMLTQSVKKMSSYSIAKQQDISLQKHISEPQQLHSSQNITYSISGRQIFSMNPKSSLRQESPHINESKHQKPIYPNKQKIEQQIKKSSLILKMTELFGNGGLENYLLFFQNYKDMSQEEILNKWAQIHNGWTIVDDDIINEALQE